jgi:hypothetical protein
VIAAEPTPTGRPALAVLRLAVAGLRRRRAAPRHCAAARRVGHVWLPRPPVFAWMTRALARPSLLRCRHAPAPGSPAAPAADTLGPGMCRVRPVANSRRCGVRPRTAGRGSARPPGRGDAAQPIRSLTLEGSRSSWLFQAFCPPSCQRLVSRSTTAYSLTAPVNVRAALHGCARA